MARSRNWDNNYMGMHVPNGHGSIFRGMDYDKMLADRATASLQQQIQSQLNEAKGRAIYRLDVIESNCMNVFTTTFLDALKGLITDIDIDLVKNNKSNLIFGLEGGAMLAPSKQWRQIKTQFPEVFAKYKMIYDSIREPFRSINKKLQESASNTHVEILEQQFMSNINYLENYFEFLNGSKGNNIALIRPKENILILASELNTAAKNTLEQETEEVSETAASEDLAEVRELTTITKQPSQLMGPLQIGQEQESCESDMEQMQAKIKEMEALLVAKDQENNLLKDKLKNYVKEKEVADAENQRILAERTYPGLVDVRLTQSSISDQDNSSIGSIRENYSTDSVASSTSSNSTVISAILRPINTQSLFSRDVLYKSNKKELNEESKSTNEVRTHRKEKTDAMRLMQLKNKQFLLKVNKVYEKLTKAQLDQEGLTRAKVCSYGWSLLEKETLEKIYTKYFGQQKLGKENIVRDNDQTLNNLSSHNFLDNSFTKGPKTLTLKNNDIELSGDDSLFGES